MLKCTILSHITNHNNFAFHQATFLLTFKPQKDAFRSSRYMQIQIVLYIQIPTKSGCKDCKYTKIRALTVGVTANKAIMCTCLVVCKCSHVYGHICSLYCKCVCSYVFVISLISLTRLTSITDRHGTDVQQCSSRHK